MAIKNIIAKGIGFSPGSTKWIPTHGFSSAVANPVLGTPRLQVGMTYIPGNREGLAYVPEAKKSEGYSSGAKEGESYRPGDRGGLTYIPGVKEGETKI